LGEFLFIDALGVPVIVAKNYSLTRPEFETDTGFPHIGDYKTNFSGRFGVVISTPSYSGDFRFESWPRVLSILTDFRKFPVFRR